MNSRVFSSAYNLGYRGVNISTLYVGYGLLIFVPWLTTVNMNYKFKVAFGNIFYLAGAILMAISIWFKGNSKMYFAA